MKKKITEKETGGKKKNPDPAHNKNKGKRNNFPGYPHYPAGEDIVNNLTKVDAELDNIDRGINPVKEEQKRKKTEVPPVDNELSEKPFLTDEEADEENESQNEADLTKEDRIVLTGEEEHNIDVADEDLEVERVWTRDMAGDDLDVPGTELDDENEEIGEEDEENNLYSLPDDQ